MKLSFLLKACTSPNLHLICHSLECVRGSSHSSTLMRGGEKALPAGHASITLHQTPYWPCWSCAYHPDAQTSATLLMNCHPLSLPFLLFSCTVAGSSQSLQQLRFLALKNLAPLLEGSPQEQLQLYGEAIRCALCACGEAVRCTLCGVPALPHTFHATVPPHTAIDTCVSCHLLVW